MEKKTTNSFGAISRREKFEKEVCSRSLHINIRRDTGFIQYRHTQDDEEREQQYQQYQQEERNWVKNIYSWKHFSSYYYCYYEMMARTKAAATSKIVPEKIIH
jgi:hypothetical protein